MKLLTIIYDASIERSLADLLEELDTTAWTKLEGLSGRGEAGLKVNSPVWPGLNNLMIIAGQEEMLRQVATGVRAMQEEFKLRPGIFMSLQEIEEL